MSCIFLFTCIFKVCCSFASEVDSLVSVLCSDMHAILRVILGPDSSQRVMFSAGLPLTVAELETKIKTVK